MMEKRYQGEWLSLSSALTPPLAVEVSVLPLTVVVWGFNSGLARVYRAVCAGMNIE
jgi:hypothetical protein